MVWFNEWWDALGLLGQIMACAAIPMTLLMILQLIMLLVGSGPGDSMDTDFDSDLDADFDTDFDTDFDVDTDGPDFDHAGAGHDYTCNDPSHSHYGGDGGHGSDLKLFTIRGIVAFFAIGGWAGLAAVAGGIPGFWSVQISIAAGAAAMLFAAYSIRLIVKMQSDGTIQLKNTLGSMATVYMTVPPYRGNTGKVNLLVQDRFVELDAVTDSREAIRVNTEVKVVGLTDDSVLIVTPVEDLKREENKCQLKQ